MAINESPPSSKKLALRSTVSTPRHLAQMSLQRRFDLDCPSHGRIRHGEQSRWKRQPACRWCPRNRPPSRPSACGRPNASGVQTDSRAATHAAADDRATGVSSRRRFLRPTVGPAPAGRCRGHPVLSLVPHEPNGAMPARPSRMAHRRSGQSPTGTRPRPGRGTDRPASRRASSANLTVARICRAHMAGSVASSAVIQVPVTFDSKGVCGS